MLFLVEPVEQQDREQHDKQTEGNTGGIHRATLVGEFCTKPDRRPSLAEKPKVGELQMDWLRSEDLKEEKA